jgi:hypothetical protein
MTWTQLPGTWGGEARGGELQVSGTLTAQDVEAASVDQEQVRRSWRAGFCGDMTRIDHQFLRDVASMFALSMLVFGFVLMANGEGAGGVEQSFVGGIWPRRHQGPSPQVRSDPRPGVGCSTSPGGCPPQVHPAAPASGSLLWLARIGPAAGDAGQFRHSCWAQKWRGTKQASESGATIQETGDYVWWFIKFSQHATRRNLASLYTHMCITMSECRISDSHWHVASSSRQVSRHPVSRRHGGEKQVKKTIERRYPISCQPCNANSTRSPTSHSAQLARIVRTSSV